MTRTVSGVSGRRLGLFYGHRTISDALPLVVVVVRCRMKMVWNLGRVGDRNGTETPCPPKASSSAALHLTPNAPRRRALPEPPAVLGILKTRHSLPSRTLPFASRAALSAMSWTTARSTKADQSSNFGTRGSRWAINSHRQGPLFWLSTMAALECPRRVRLRTWLWWKQSGDFKSSKMGGRPSRTACLLRWLDRRYSPWLTTGTGASQAPGNAKSVNLTPHSLLLTCYLFIVS
jgi:hypothetical protein